VTLTEFLTTVGVSAATSAAAWYAIWWVRLRIAIRRVWRGEVS